MATSAGSPLDVLIAEYEAAERAFADTRGLPDGSPEELRFLAALDALDTYIPRTSQEFTRSLSIRFSSDSPPTEESVEKLIGIARHLTTKGF